MASKYILTRDQFVINESLENQPIFNFLNEVGVELMEMLDTIKPVLPESVSDEFIDQAQAYSTELKGAGFDQESKLEHILYAMGTSGTKLFSESNFQIESVINHYYEINEDFFDTLRSIWNALTENGSPLGILHLILDIIGFIPFTYLGVPIDVAADAINALIYLFEGQYGSAIISAIAAAIPGFGDFAKTLKISKGFKSINGIAEVAFKTGKADAKLVSTLAKTDPSAFAKFIEMFSSAKPVVSFFANIVKGIGRGIEALLRSWPISMLFGKLGQKLGKWLDEAVVPITKNLDSAIDDMATLTTKGSDDITAAIKAGDASKVADTGTEFVSKLADDLTAAKAAGNVDEIKRIEGILQSRIEKGLPGAGRFVKNGRLLDVVNSNLKISDDLLKKGGKELEQFLEKGFDDYVKAWKEVKQVKGVPLTADDIKKLEELKGLWMEGRKAEALFAGVKKLDDIPVDELVKLTGNAAEIATTKGANFSARLIDELSADPAKLSKFFNGVLANPKTLAKLEEAGPGVVGLYRLFAKNPEVYTDIAKAGQAAMKHFDDLAKVGGKWSQAVRASRVVRNKLIIAKNIIGAPLRCPIAGLGQGNMGGIEALGQFKIKTSAKESYRFIMSRDEFLFENEPVNSEPKTAASDEIQQQIDGLKNRPKAVLGPLSYVDVCQSHINKVMDDAAKAAALPPKDSSLTQNGPDKNYAAAGPSSDASIKNQEQIAQTLGQMGIKAPISSAGMLVELPADATVYEVANTRIDTDITYGGLWYMLAAVMVRDLDYAEVKGKIKSALNDYADKYQRTAGNKLTTGAISFYPSPGEVNLIKSELSMLDQDPTYSPNFFGPQISASDLLNMY